jgi:hypothetical protein
MPCNFSGIRVTDLGFMRAAQIIALLLPESKQDAPEQDALALETATALMRDAEGRMSLQPLTHELTREMPFKEQVMTTGCFRRGKPIVDPTTREVIGYEMEMITGPEARLSSARLQLGLC